MLSSCANPDCSATFRYLHEGELFFLPVSNASRDGDQMMETFWVCDECCRLYTVAVLGGRVRVTPVKWTPTLPEWREPQLLSA
jgi:hypothetical protein